MREGVRVARRPHRRRAGPGAPRKREWRKWEWKWRRKGKLRRRQRQRRWPAAADDAPVPDLEAALRQDPVGEAGQGRGRDHAKGGEQGDHAGW